MAEDIYTAVGGSPRIKTVIYTASCNAFTRQLCTVTLEPEISRQMHVTLDLLFL